jgi:hypothetical protein
VSGCYWGDDMSWKIQYLDLSEVERGIIRRDDRFGYIAQPEKCTLEQAICLCAYEPTRGYHVVEIAVQTAFNLRTGQRYRDDDDEHEPESDGV